VAMTIDVRPAQISSINRRLRALEKFGRDQKTFNTSVTRKFDALIRNDLAQTVRIDRLERKVDAGFQALNAQMDALEAKHNDIMNKLDKILTILDVHTTEIAAIRIGLGRLERRVDRLEAKVGV
jgi:uncharacterized coiled-coil DUF342 family protein